MGNIIPGWKGIESSRVQNLIENNEASFGLPGLDNPQAFAQVLNALSQNTLRYNGKHFEAFDADDGNWRTISEHQLIQAMKDAVFQILSSVLKVKEQDGGKPWIAYHYRKIVEELKIILSADDEDDLPRNCCHVKNGFLRPNGDSWMLTVNADGKDFRAVRSIPMDYDPQATCPQYDAYLERIFPDAADRSCLQQYIGQHILGMGNTTHRIYIIDGLSDMGQSGLTTIITTLVGEAKVAVLPEGNFGDRFELRRYAGKSCILARDIPADGLKGSPWIMKALTGGDYLQGVCRTGGHEVGFCGNLSIFLFSSEPLRLQLQSKSDRMAFEHRLIRSSAASEGNIVKADLDRILVEEGSGILNWILDGAMQVYLNQGDIKMTEEQKERVKALLDEADAARSFVESWVTEGGDTDTVAVFELLEAYRAYCKAKQWDPLSERLAKKEIKCALLRKFPNLHQRHDLMRENRASRGYAGIRLTPQQPLE